MSRTPDQVTRQRRNNCGRLADDLQALPGRTTRELREHWQSLIGIAPPGGLSRDLLMRVIADQLQEAALGGLPPTAKRKLTSLARSGDSSAETTSGPLMLRLKPGSKLVRAWRGKTHTVLVLEDGFEHQGKRYASLTQIAGEVTGAHWSGPRFFGLTTSDQSPFARKSRDGSR
jgi:hypothetical protein